MYLSHRRPAPPSPRDRRRRIDGGYVLAKFALLLVPLLLMTGLSVDVGYWYNRAAEIQKAADAAALAGVVWLPDLRLAEQYAVQAAAKNGFIDGVGDVSVSIERAGERRLKVAIRDGSVGSFLFLSLGGDEIEVTREGLAEYVLPVPMGSPRNYFGTGRLLSGTDQELLYQSVNPSCTSKVQGDRHQSLHMGGSVLSSCPAAASNVDYRSRGYELYIEAKAGRPANIDVLLYDPRYSGAGVTYQVENGQDCTTTPIYSPTSPSWTTPTSVNVPTILAGPAEYQQRGTVTGSFGSTQSLPWGQTVSVSDARMLRYRVAATWTPSPITWTGPTSSTNQTPLTITGPAVYQTRNDSTTTTFNTPVFLNDGQTFTLRRDRFRYRTAAFTNNVACSPHYDNVTEPAIDNLLNGGNEDEDFTFTLFAADSTPLTDEDNPLVSGCQKKYTPTSAFELTYLGSVRWNKLCTITTDMPSGRYILRVQNEGSAHDTLAEGSNQWGLVAKYTSASGQGLCDGRVDPVCPRVYGRDAISVYANTSAGVAQFFLAEIEPEHTGKTLELELWDPGEGGSNIQFQQPTGPNTWASVPFSWTSYHDDGTRELSGSGTSVSLRDTNGDRFNGKLLRILIPLTGYNPPADNRWWKIQYTFGTGNVTDRTTWSARVIGDPVHLLEEEAD